jgi:hypothetical protein
MSLVLESYIVHMRTRITHRKSSNRAFLNVSPRFHLSRIALLAQLCNRPFGEPLLLPQYWETIHGFQVEMRCLHRLGQSRSRKQNACLDLMEARY